MKNPFCFCFRLAQLAVAWIVVANMFAAAHAYDQPQPPGSVNQNDHWDAVALDVPDTPVLDQTGKEVRFYTDLVKGRTVAINFIFTSCKTSCSTATALFSGVQQHLGKRVGQDIALISVSIDPATDTPEQLKHYATMFHAGEGWAFVRSTRAETDQLLKALGAYSPDKITHTPLIVIGNDTTGNWTRLYGLASVSTIATTIRDIADHRSMPTEDLSPSGQP